MVTEDADREKYENDDRGADTDKVQNCSPGFHRCGGLTACVELCSGLAARVEGRASSPVLNANAAAAVKIADWVSWLTLRAEVRFRSAVTTSTYVLSPFL